MADKKGSTLWERWTGQVKVEPTRIENLIFNPLNLLCGDFVTARMFMDMDRTFSVVSVNERTRTVGGETFKTTDYLLRDKDDVRILRVNPKANCDPSDLQKCDLLWLFIEAEMEYNEGLAEAVTLEKFVEFDDEESEQPSAEFDPLGAGPDGFQTKVQIAKPGAENLVRNSLLYWDYYRTGKPEKGERASEYVFKFIEMDERTKWFTILQGTQVSGNDIEVTPAPR